MVSSWNDWIIGICFTELCNFKWKKWNWVSGIIVLGEFILKIKVYFKDPFCSAPLCTEQGEWFYTIWEGNCWFSWRLNANTSRIECLLRELHGVEEFALGKILLLPIRLGISSCEPWIAFKFLKQVDDIIRWEFLKIHIYDDTEFN